MTEFYHRVLDRDRCITLLEYMRGSEKCRVETLKDKDVLWLVNNKEEVLVKFISLGAGLNFVYLNKNYFVIED